MVVQRPEPRHSKQSAAPHVAARRTQAERRSEAKDGLLGAAAELFAEQGVAETSLAQIGERAGYSLSLIHI